MDFFRRFVEFFAILLLVTIVFNSEEDNLYALDVQQSLLALPAEVPVEMGTVSLSLRTLTPEDLDEALDVPQKDKVQSIQMILADFTGPAKVAHPELSFLYVHYRAQANSKIPNVLFFYTDRDTKPFETNKLEDGHDWMFKVETFDATALTEQEVNQGFYAMHKVFVQFSSIEAQQLFINPNKAVFKIQRALKRVPSIEDTPSLPATKKSSLLRSIRKSLKTSFQGMAAALRMTPSAKRQDEDDLKPKVSLSAPSLNLNESTKPESDC